MVTWVLENYGAEVNRMDGQMEWEKQRSEIHLSGNSNSNALGIECSVRGKSEFMVNGFETPGSDMR